MRLIRSHIVSRIFCVLMALHIFNVSLDMPDAQPYYEPEDLSINDQESFMELVAEGWLGIDNAFEEHDEPGDETMDLELNKEFKITHHAVPEIKFHRSVTEIVPTPYQESCLSEYLCEINPPPPKA